MLKVDYNFGEIYSIFVPTEVFTYIFSFESYILNFESTMLIQN